ncbi:hypothetical protein C1878_01495 [Gordonibacter sp. 28C]|uniref:hypothetical protein n=1 Tax=Gordonibacter sp. 28C TaxID=2078569 RepID=UPI000DF775E1|nr:hypothetical protein [Gordonibacter sp. 28C]RDB64549.1 hypothetical protein C1878_01495 [Gordonibacter sp. 28C]
MTFVRILSILLFLALVGGSIAVHRHLRRTVEDGNGVGDVNERGLDGLSDAGVCVGSVGSPQNEDRRL